MTGNTAIQQHVGEKVEMKRFEYEITSHPAGTFKDLIYFCSEQGVCTLETVPSDQIKRMEGILNERGRNGWEIVQVTFGKDGILAFWKRKVGETINGMASIPSQ